MYEPLWKYLVYNNFVLIIKWKEKMKKEFHHYAFGLFIEELLKFEHVKITEMCHEIKMSKETYEQLKKGMIKNWVFTNAF